MLRPPRRFGDPDQTGDVVLGDTAGLTSPRGETEDLETVEDVAEVGRPPRLDDAPLDEELVPHTWEALPRLVRAEDGAIPSPLDLEDRVWQSRPLEEVGVPLPLPRCEGAAPV